MKKSFFLGMVSAAALAIGWTEDAHAFGPTCVPHLSNCMCTHRVPCPVQDNVSNLRETLKIDELEKAIEMYQEIKDPQAMLMKVLRGENVLGIPGIDSIGIDLNGIISGDLSSLGLPESISGLASDLSDIGITPDVIVSVATGNLAPDQLFDLALDAGVDAMGLESMGLPVDMVSKLASGDLEVGDVLGLASDLGLQGNVLQNLGIDEALFVDIANGVESFERIAQIANNAGLAISDLEAIGLDMSAVKEMAKLADPSAVMGIMQDIGIDTTPLTGLGLDLQMIGDIASGKLPETAINTLVASTGIDPTAITIPGVTGPISLDGLRPEAMIPGSVMTIPVDSVPGLSNVLSIASGGSGAGGGFADAQNSAMCSGDKSLISVSLPPNTFGDDMATIDMAISGANLEAFPEVVSDVDHATASTAGIGLGRAIMMRELLIKAMEAVDTFNEMVDQAKTVQDDFAVNDTIRAHYMTAVAETTSLYAAVMSAQAASRVNSEVLSPTPIFPQDSRFEQYVSTNVTAPAKAAKETASKIKESSADFAGFMTVANDAIHNYNLIHDAIDLEDSIPLLEETIDYHETIKDHIFLLEAVIKNRLSQLYVEDPEDVWALLRPVLVAEAGNYLSPSKWSEGFSDAKSLSAQVTAQAASTPYGTRKLNAATTPSVMAGGGDPADTGPTYTEASETAYSYPAIDSYASSIPDPYSIVPRHALEISLGDGDTAMPPNMELVGVFQYYLETLRRMDYQSDIRRGSVSVSMTSAFWNEMYHHAPECLSGPLSATVENLNARPDLFDLSKTCTHLVWEGADEGEYIDPSNLGGVDSALWLTKITLDRVLAETGGSTQVLQDLQDAYHAAVSEGLVENLAGQGRSEQAASAENALLLIDQALSDPTFGSDIDYP